MPGLTTQRPAKGWHLNILLLRLRPSRVRADVMRLRGCHALARLLRTTVIAIVSKTMVMMASPMLRPFRIIVVGGSPVMRMAVMVFGGKIGVIVPVVMIAGEHGIERREQGHNDNPAWNEFFHTGSPGD
jgi:hypothetical protein